MKVLYYFRHPAIAHSIHRVFRTLIRELAPIITVNEIEMPCKGSMPWDVLRNNVYTFKQRDKNSIHHVTGHIHDILLALVGSKTVLTIHDLVFIDNVRNPIKRFYKWLFWLYLPVKLATRVVCISELTKQKVDKLIKNNKTLVIHNALDPIYSYVPKTFNSSKPVILHIGTGWNKNLERTIEALEGIACHLRIIGKLTTNQADLLKKHAISYSNAYNLTDQEIATEYNNCDIVNFPSIYEGFGMPIIEGQATGRVVITADIEPLIEVSGGAVCFVNNNDIQSIRMAYLKIIKESAYREKLVIDGLENVKRFDNKLIASKYLELYTTL